MADLGLHVVQVSEGSIHPHWRRDKLQAVSSRRAQTRLIALPRGSVLHTHGRHEASRQRSGCHECTQSLFRRWPEVPSIHVTLSLHRSQPEKCAGLGCAEQIDLGAPAAAQAPYRVSSSEWWDGSIGAASATKSISTKRRSDVVPYLSSRRPRPRTINSHVPYCRPRRGQPTPPR